jgi:hypothetical protein
LSLVATADGGVVARGVVRVAATDRGADAVRVVVSAAANYTVAESTGSAVVTVTQLSQATFNVLFIFPLSYTGTL